MPASIKILHTSDLHLDSRFVGITDPASRAKRRKEHHDVVKRIVDLALEEEVDLALFVGDLFEESTYQLDTISFLVEEFGRLHPRPVFVGPGLSDAYHRKSPYDIFDWGENVHIFTKSRFSSVSIPDLGVRVHGVAPDRDRIEANLLRGLRARGDGLLEIGMLYGSSLDRVPEAADCPFPFREADVGRTGVHYLALGGYHSFQRFGTGPVACYPGMPEGTGFDQLGEKVVIIAEASRKEVTLSQQSVAMLVFKEVTIDLTGLSTVDGVVRALEHAVAAQDSKEALVRVRMIGCPPPGVDLAPANLAHRIHVERGHLEVLDETGPAPDWEEIRKRKTLAGAFARVLQKKVDSKESARYEKVRDYGLSALTGKEELKLGRKPPS